MDGVVALIASALYPNGTDKPSIVAFPVLVYQGWPEPQSLDTATKAGKAHISVFPRPGGKVTTVMMGDTDWDEAENDGTSGVGALEVRRQSRTAQITFWAATPAHRDALAKVVDVTLAMTTRIDLVDGSRAILTAINETQIDAQQKSGIYRRDLLYSINYATTFTQAQTTITTIAGTLSAGPTPDAVGPDIPLS
jgi:hypothetical protein